MYLREKIRSFPFFSSNLFLYTTTHGVEVNICFPPTKAFFNAILLAFQTLLKKFDKSGLYWNPCATHVFMVLDIFAKTQKIYQQFAFSEGLMQSEDVSLTVFTIFLYKLTFTFVVLHGALDAYFLGYDSQDTMNFIFFSSVSKGFSPLRVPCVAVLRAF